MTIEPGEYAPPLREGIRYRGSFIFTDDADDQPLPFDGCTFRAQVRTRQNAEGSPLIDVTSTASADGQIIVHGPGSVEVFFTKEATARLQGVRRFSWDLIVHWANGIDNDVLLYAVDADINQTTTEPA